MKHSSEYFELLKLQYQSLANRELSHHSAIWNTLSIFFLAETLLWTIAFQSHMHPFVSFALSLMAIFVSQASCNQLVRWRAMQIADSVQLRNIEDLFAESFSEDEKHAMLNVHDKLENRTIYRNSSITNLKLDLILNNDFYKENPASQQRAFDTLLFFLKCMRTFSIAFSLYFFIWVLCKILH